ncbi:hypothetical protein V8G54_000473 [Vigna mungo]|uniref:F-box protein n=1 Tax=Vigna mungo TaxID=3915 RepID=A0AAQ3P5C2_VIGMU
MSTCKILSKFPKESDFAFKQAQHAILRDETCFLIQPEIPMEATKWCNQPVEFHPLPGEELSSGMSKNVLAFFSKGVKILCSTNGLALCSMFGENEVKFFIINPATQSWSPIPTHDHLQNSSFYDHKIGFLCDSDGNFMIYHFIDDLVDWSSYFGCNVYKEGMWKAKERFFSGSRSLRFDMPVYHKGAIHFISDCSSYLTRNNPYFRPYIMSYNFEDGKSRMLRIPKEARKTTDSNQSICLVRLRKDVFTVWVLTEYKSSLWKKILKIRVRAMEVLENDPYQIVVKSFIVLNGELLMFTTEKKVYLYGFSDNKIHKFWDYESDFNFLRCIPYIDTLRPCDIGTGNLSLPIHV